MPRLIDAGVFIGKKTFAPDVYPISGPRWIIVMASAEHDSHRVQNQGSTGIGETAYACAFAQRLYSGG